MSSNVNVQLKLAFGAKQGNLQVYHTDENKVVYAAGMNIVSYSTSDKHMEFFSSLEEARLITCLAASPLRRYLAVAVQSERPFIVIYDTQTLKRKKALTTADVISDRYVAMAFAPGQESKYLVSMGGGPDWSLVYWDWESTTMQALIRVGVPINDISFNQLDYERGIIVTGEDVFRWYRIVEGQGKLEQDYVAPLRPSQKIIKHAWTKFGNIVLPTSNGEGSSGDVYVLTQEWEHIYTIMCMADVCSILIGEKCMILAGLKGYLEIYDINEEEQYQLVSKSQVKTESKIVCMSLNPSETSLVCGFNDSQIMTWHFEKEKLYETLNFSYLSHEFHDGPITGLDVWIRKSLIATWGQDRTIKIWNISEKSLEVSEIYGETPFCIAFHPSGFHLVAGFSDKVRLMNVFSKSIEPYKELNIKNCKELRFSNGGHLFAAANAQLISVYNFYTGECPAHHLLKGHAGKIQSINWLSDDSGLVSASSDGSIFEWNIGRKAAELSQEQEYQEKGVLFTDIALLKLKGNTHRSIFTIGDKWLKEIEDSSCTRRHKLGANAGAFVVTNNMSRLFLGLTDGPGDIRCYNIIHCPECEKQRLIRCSECESEAVPLTNDFFSFNAHEKGITRMRMTHDDKNLYTVGKDGVVCIFDFKSRSESSGFRREKDITIIPPSEEIIITKAEVEDLSLQIETNQATYTEAVNQNQLQFDLAVQEKVDLIEQIKESSLTNAQKGKKRLDSQQEKSKENENKYEDQIRTKRENFEIEKTELDAKYQQKIVKDVEKFDNLQSEKDKEFEHYTAMIEKLKQDNANVVEERKRRAAMDIEDEKVDKKAAMERLEQVQRRQDEIRRQIDANNGVQRSKLDDSHENLFNGVKSKISQRKGKFSILKKKYETLQHEIDSNKDERKILEENKAHNSDLIAKLLVAKNQMRQEVSERDKTIGEKERRIYDLKRKNQELEKFKFVLDYKIKELKRDVVPREEEISHMKEQTNMMDNELQNLNAVNENLGVVIDDLRVRQDTMIEEQQVQRSKLREYANKINTFKDGLQEAVQAIQNPRLLKAIMVRIFNEQVKLEGSKQADTGNELKIEYGLQKGYLLKNAKSLKEKFMREQGTHRQDCSKMMQENVKLIEQISKLREQMKVLAPVRRQAELMTAKSTPSFNRPSTDRRGTPDPSGLTEIKTQRHTIKSLRQRVQELESPSKRPNTRGLSPLFYDVKLNI